MDPSRLARAISTFERRRTEVPKEVPVGLTDAFSEDSAHKARWRAFLDKNRLEGPNLAELVREIRDAVEPVLDDARR